MQNLQRPPCGPPRIDFTFIRIREQLDFLFLHDHLLTLGQPYNFLHIFDHVLISFCLFCHLCEVDGLLQFQCHIIVQMNHCHRHILYEEKLMKQEQAMVLMEELMEKEKNVHVEEIRIIKQNLEDYAREKQREIQLYEGKFEKIVAKLNSYKQKNQKLNEKIKEQSNTIKSFMENRLKLDAEILKLQANVQKERRQCEQQLKYRSEMKQMMNLQEFQIEQLKHQNKRLKETIIYLQKQLASYNQIGEKYLNIGDISQEQYQKQISLLKQSLQQQFCKTTHQIFDCISPRGSQNEALYQKDMNREHIFQSNDSIEAQELKKISNYIDYGKTYFQLEDVQLTLKESQKIVLFIAGLVKQYRQLEQQYNNQRKNNYSIREQLQQRLLYFSDEIGRMGQKKYRNQQTQTCQYSKITEVINMNHQLKMKNLEILKIITFFSKFSIFLFKTLVEEQTKMKYFLFSEAFLYRNINPKRNKLKSVVYSIIFINILTKNGKKSRKYAQTNDFRKQNLEMYIKDIRLKNLVYNFSLGQCKKLSSKNHKIQQLSSNRSDIRPQQKSIQILSQQSLNQGLSIQDHSSLFSKFTFEINSKFP